MGIDNPEYKGEWKPTMIDNPDYKGGSVGFELWQVKAGTIFDNIIVTDSIEEAEQFLEETCKANKDAEKKMFDDIEAEKRKKEEEERKKREEERKKAEEEAEDD